MLYYKRHSSCSTKTEYLSPVVKRAGREADHSLPISVEGDNKWGYTSNPLQAVTVAQ